MSSQIKPKLGLHKDKDEKCFKAPVLSISLGNTAVFKYGKTKQTLKQAILLQDQ